MVGLERLAQHGSYSRREREVKLRFTTAASLVALVVAPGALAVDRPQAQLVDPIRITIQGQHIIGGCQYEGEVVVRPGQPAVEQHEVLEDPTTCTLMMEQGTPVDGNGPHSDRTGHATLSVSNEAMGAQPVSTFSAAAATTHSAGYSKTWVEDPPGIDVNYVENEIDWYWDDPYLTPGATETCTATYDWFWQSGWGLHENNFQCNFNTPDYPQTWIDSTSYVHYKNGVFCGFTDTHVYYDRNHAVGYGNGNLVGRWNVRKSGFCSGALSVHNRTERTMN
jgi:hypothetical protein